MGNEAINAAVRSALLALPWVSAVSATSFAGEAFSGVSADCTDANGKTYRLSIQFHSGAYSNVNRPMYGSEENEFEAALIVDEGFVRLAPYDDVLGYVTLDTIIATVAVWLRR